MAGSILAALTMAPAGVSGGPGAASGPQTAAASVLLLWLCLFGAFGLLLFWSLPILVAALIARGRDQNPASALLWAGLLGWTGVLLLLWRRAEKECPHCHTHVVAETTDCYWCGGDTVPSPLPAELRA